MLAVVSCLILPRRAPETKRRLTLCSHYTRQHRKPTWPSREAEQATEKDWEYSFHGSKANVQRLETFRQERQEGSN
jgi:hypothetical protein